MIRWLFIKYISLTQLSLVLCFIGLSVSAQKNSGIITDSSSLKQGGMLYYKSQMDLVDIIFQILGKNPDTRLDSNGIKVNKVYTSVGPVLEYTLSTGFTIGVAASGSFLTSKKGQTNTSIVLAAVKFTQKNQFLLPVQSSVWTHSNKYFFIGDWRYLNYPQDTYGFGGYTSLADGYIVTYKYIRFYETALKKIRENIYAGIGYQLDYHWGINQINPPPGKTDYDLYGYYNTSTSSGITLDILYDSRKNAANPPGGSFFCNLSFLQNSTHLGSNSNWNSVLIDVRKYFKMPNNNVLAFWSYNVFTLSGNPPYLDLPGTGTDTYNNTGRGYIYDRFIGKKMVDLEAEFRFGITKNGLFGAVVFANAESLSEMTTDKFQVISPAAGLGLRFKFNKFSNTNVCIDYAIGTNGSRGFYGNLGEVF
ncbi:MAG TPA: hypothetical protein VNW49_13060 [Puia sp.]|nr:hypothetical protein [Puia sp.]